jgi:hypothetical protein
MLFDIQQEQDIEFNSKKYTPNSSFKLDLISLALEQLIQITKT